MFALQFSKFKNNSYVVWQLVKTDWTAFRKTMVSSAIDTAIVMALMVSAMTYVMPILEHR